MITFFCFIEMQRLERNNASQLRSEDVCAGTRACRACQGRRRVRHDRRCEHAGIVCRWRRLQGGHEHVLDARLLPSRVARAREAHLHPLRKQRLPQRLRVAGGVADGATPDVMASFEVLEDGWGR